MDDFIGIDVSMKETAISIRRAGIGVWGASVLPPLKGLPAICIDARHSLRIRAADLSRQLVVDARQSQTCRILMSIPGRWTSQRPLCRPSKIQRISKRLVPSAAPALADGPPPPIRRGRL